MCVCHVCGDQISGKSSTVNKGMCVCVCVLGDHSMDNRSDRYTDFLTFDLMNAYYYDIVAATGENIILE